MGRGKSGILLNNLMSRWGMMAVNQRLYGAGSSPTPPEEPDFPIYSGNSYYVREDGIAENKAAATSDSGASTSMSVSTYEGETFADGDRVYFSGLGGVYRRQVTFHDNVYNVGTNSPEINGSNLVTGWSVDSGSRYVATVSTEPEQVWYDGTFGTRKTSAAACTAEGDWYWSSNSLYFYSGAGDPDTGYTSPGIEASARNYCALANSGDNLWVDGIDMVKTNLMGIFCQFMSDVTIKNCNVEWAWISGISLNVGSGTGERYLIEDNVVSKCGTIGISVTSGAGSALKDVIIRRNEASWMSYYHEANPWWETGDGGHEFPGGIKVFFGGSAVVERVEIYDNHVHDIGGSIQQKGNGIWLDYVYSTNLANGTKIYRNWIEDCYKNGVFIECCDYSQTFGNIMINCGTATNSESGGYRLDCRGSSNGRYNLLYNNVIYGGRFGVWAQSYNQTGCQMSYNEFKNNIVTDQTVFSWSLDLGPDNRESSDYVQGTTGWKGEGNVYLNNCTPEGITMADITGQGVTSELSTWAAFAAKVDYDNHLPTGYDYDGGSTPVDGNGGYWWGNGWTQSGNSNVRYVTVRGARTGTPDSNNIYVRLYDNGVGDEPGSILATATLNVNDFLTDSDVHVFDFGSNQTLSDGNKYYLIVVGSWSHDNSNCFYIDYRGVGAPTGNTWWSWRGSSWQLEDTSNDYGAIVGLTGSHDPTACNGIQAAPRYAGVANDNYFLSSLSPCIAAGVNLGENYDDLLDRDDVWTDGVTGASPSGDWDVGPYVFPYTQSTGLYSLNFADATWNSGYFEGQDDQYGAVWAIDGGDDSHNLSELEVNDSVQMLALKQQDATGANKTYRCSDEQILAVGTKYKFRMLVDVPTADTGHQIRFLTNNSAGDYVIWKILGNGIIQCQVKTNTRINQAGLTPGNLTVMGYYTGTVFHMKAKNGHDASMSWTLWNGSDADAYGNYTETLSQLGFWIGLGISSDTAPLTHGWVKTFELMTNEYGSWAD